VNNYHGGRAYEQSRTTIGISTEAHAALHEQATRAGISQADAASIIMLDWCERFELEPPQRPKARIRHRE
jgi:hypothetical protein